MYSTVSNTFLQGQSGAINYYGVAISGDGNIASVSNAFIDPSGNMLGGVGRPEVFFPTLATTFFPLNNYPANPLGRPRLNAPGSLYYWPTRTTSRSSTCHFIDENTFTFMVPTLATGPHDVTVMNPNGISYTLASAIIAP